MSLALIGLQSLSPAERQDLQKAITAENNQIAALPPAQQAQARSAANAAATDVEAISEIGQSVITDDLLVNQQIFSQLMDSVNDADDDG